MTTSLPRGVLKQAAEALEEARTDRTDDWAAARVVLTAALPAIERAALRSAARQILLLQEFSLGRRCPACHGKPASEPHRGEGRTGFRCGCGYEWEPPEDRDWSLSTDSLIRKLARGEPLPELPPKVEPAAPAGRDAADEAAV